MLDFTGSGPELLNPDELRTLVWSIGRFVAEESSRRVDVGKTVAATARSGGIPELYFQPLTYQRAVWLWQDEQVDDPTLERLADELEASLSRGGLPVRRGWFADVPEQIAWREGQTFSSLLQEGHRQSAIVAVLTDGQGIGIAAHADLDRRPLAQLLTVFSQWPRLTFVDFARGRYGLAERLCSYGLSCIAPEALPGFLGAGAAAPLRRRYQDLRLLGDLRAWAAAAALAPEPLAATEAFALRRGLGLPLSPWTFRDLVRAGDARGERLDWMARRRAELLNWLVRAEGRNGELAPESLPARALDFWQERLARERTARERQDNDLMPWAGSLAEQRLAMEEALLKLWREPRQAAQILFRLYRKPGGGAGPLAGEIAGRLGKFAPREWRGQGGRAVVFLPWRWETLDDKTRYMLGFMSFGKGILPAAGKLRRPGRVALAAGLCWGWDFFSFSAAPCAAARVPPE